MLMKKELLELHLSQLSKAWRKTKSLKYHDKRLQEHISLLDSLFHKLQENINEDEIENKDFPLHKAIIDFLFRNIEFIDSSTLNLIPFELVKCLEAVLQEWLPDFDSYIIVTAQRQGIYSYSIQPSSDEQICQIIKELFGIDFSYKLIQLNIPKHLSRDYLANVVLYHEIGHFIDFHYKISYTICYLKFIKKTLKLSLPDCDECNQSQFYSHLMEYFADIFAAQYVDKTCGYYLNYIAYKDPSCNTHPSTENRWDIVNDFVGGVKNQVIEEFNNVAAEIANNNLLQIRSADIKIDSLINLIPEKITKNTELHSVFIGAWNIWLEQRQKVHDINKMQFDLEPTKLYLILNGLIEKSINNYITCEQWNKYKEI